jgi:hypothetical protein
MTTYIAQLKSMGDYSTAIAVGIVLLILAFLINTFLYNVQQRVNKTERKVKDYAFKDRKPDKRIRWPQGA